MKIVTAAEMRAIEQECVKLGLPTDVLMENAGRTVADEVGNILKRVKQQRILCLVGPGNNGGDGLVAARYLHERGAEVTVFLAARRHPDDINLAKVKQLNIACIEMEQDSDLGKFNRALSSANCVLDALFGTGKVRPFSGVMKQTLEHLNNARRKDETLLVVAIDLPSGLDADTGAVDATTPYADDTITLGFPKPGLFLFPGAERVGRLTVADIGITARLSEPVRVELMTEEWAKNMLPPRPLNANKGTFGKALVVGGSLNYIGAAYLACSGAMRVGVGLVTLATPRSLLPVLAAKLTETTYLPLPESQGTIAAEALPVIAEKIVGYDALLLGCGLGQNPSTAAFVEKLILNKLPPAVIDADGLNNLAGIKGWWEKLPEGSVITPHPGEMSRLLGKTIAEVQADRFAIARAAAGEWRKIVVLKGAYTIVASPDGRTRVSPFANPGLATAGTGDVLSGVIAGLLAQGVAPFNAAAFGVYLHGKVGEWVRANLGDAGMLASDLLLTLPVVIKELKSGGSEKERYVTGD